MACNRPRRAKIFIQRNTDRAHISWQTSLDANLIERPRNWLLSKREADGSWAPDNHRMEFGQPMEHGELARLASTAYVAWAVYGSKADSAGARSTLDFLLNYRASDIKDPYLLALTANALLVLDPTGKEAAPYVERLEFLKSTSEDGKFVWWSQEPMGRTVFYGAGVGSQVEATALAILALAQTKAHPGTMRNALAWLASKKDPLGMWYSTQATVLAFKAVLAGTRAPASEAERHITVKLGDQFQEEISILPGQAEVVKQVELTGHLKSGANRLTVKESTDTAAGYQVTFRYHASDDKPPAGPEQLAIKLDYDRKNVAVNDMVKVTAHVRNQMPQDAAMVMLELPIPAGFAPQLEDFTTLVAKDTPEPGKPIARFQVLPGKVLVYLRGLPTGQPLQLTYHLRAEMPVKITAAGARVYEYYAPERQGSSPTVPLTVTAIK